MTYRLLRTEEYFKVMGDAGRLDPMLTYLHKTGYIDGNNYGIFLTGRGMRTTQAIFRKFLVFIKKYYPDTLSIWINRLELIKNTSRELIRDSFFLYRKGTTNARSL